MRQLVWLYSLCSLGNIGPLLDELKNANYAVESENAISLIQREQLIQRWVELFDAVLKPKLTKGSFRFVQKETEREWKGIYVQKFLWGAEPAGDLLTGFLPPKKFTIYSEESVGGLMKELRLIPDPSGNVMLIQQFWQDTLAGSETNDLKVVPPLLAYAELMVSHDSRDWEVAARIKNKYLNA